MCSDYHHRTGVAFYQSAGYRVMLLDFPHVYLLFPYVYLVIQSCPTLCDPMDYSLPGSPVHGSFSGKNTGEGCHFLLQGIILTQGSNTCYLCLLHCRQILYLQSHWRSPIATLEISVCITVSNTVVGQRKPSSSSLSLIKRENTTFKFKWRCVDLTRSYSRCYYTHFNFDIVFHSSIFYKSILLTIRKKITNKNWINES